MRYDSFFPFEFLFIFVSAIALTSCSSVYHRFLCGRIVQFLTNMHATHQTIYLTRHGQSEYNYQGKIGGDSGLSMMGEKFAVALADYCVDTLTKDPETNAPRPCRLWTSSLQRTILTARHIPHPKVKPSVGGTNMTYSTEKNKDWIQMSPRVSFF